jgi:hypothetical protein
MSVFMVRVSMTCCDASQELVTIFFAYNAVQVVLSFSIFVGV